MPIVPGLVPASAEGHDLGHHQQNVLGSATLIGHGQEGQGLEFRDGDLVDRARVTARAAEGMPSRWVHTCWPKIGIVPFPCNLVEPSSDRCDVFADAGARLAKSMERSDAAGQYVITNRSLDGDVSINQFGECLLVVDIEKAVLIERRPRSSKVAST